jgi:ribose transport system ATP-binding protein
MQIVMRNIYKAFGVNRVLEGVDFSLVLGEVHALMGAKGAGKLTLMNILPVLHKKDQGTILINGKEKNVQNPK